MSERRYLCPDGYQHCTKRLQLLMPNWISRRSLSNPNTRLLHQFTVSQRRHVHRFIHLRTPKLCSMSSPQWYSYPFFVLFSIPVLHDIFLISHLTHTLTTFPLVSTFLIK